MAASKAEIEQWFDEGVAQNSAFMIVVCDTFEHGDYPVYAASADECRKEYKQFDGQNMQRVMEVYNLSDDKTEQMKEKRAWRLPKDDAAAVVAAPSRRTYAEIVVDALKDGGADVPICLLHENMTNISAVKAGTKITVGLPSHIITPNDALWFTEEGRPVARKPKYIGVIVFVPIEKYESK